MRDPIENVTRLQKQLNNLQLENQVLKNILDKAGLSYQNELASIGKTEKKENFDPEQGKRIVHLKEITDRMAKLFFSFFWGRTDVYAKRNVNKNGEAAYYPQCDNFWSDNCHRKLNTHIDCKTYNYKFYSLAAIIAVGYRINSEQAMQFRTWTTKVLDTFTKQGYVLDKSRLINGQIFDEDYFEYLIAEIQEIRASERRFYQKITDIYATAVDYDKNSQVTREFYATVQNKMHYAVHGNTAAEVIVARADHNKEHMGLKSWKNAPDGKIVKTDVSIAKNYLGKEELAELNEIVTMYLDYATRQARRHIPMTMEDWKTKLDAFLRYITQAYYYKEHNT